ncbi:MAG: hypothetical protein WCO75_06205 [Planctomycetota bacterium]|nr:MAG: hypothetical protein DWH86_02240 [Planctomycetota bacterium]
MKHTATAVVVALPLVCAAVAVAGGGSINPGVDVTRVVDSPFEVNTANDYGLTPGHYQASVPGNSADLNWLTDGSNFVGVCTGNTDPTTGIRTLFGGSKGITLVTLATDTTFAINYNMTGVVRVGNDVSWALIDTTTTDAVFGLTFEDTTATATGGVSSASAAGSFSGTASAGTYWLIMAAYCEQLGGTFSYDATFSAVPAPGAFPAILMAAALRGRRRR